MSRHSSRRSPRVRRRYLALLLLPALACVWAGSRLLVSGLASYQTQAFLSAWQQQGGQPSPTAWDIAQQAAQRAIDWYPGSSAEHWQRLGLVWQWRHWQAEQHDPQAHHSRQQALYALRQASALRPTWPRYWSELAYAKWQLQEFDDEFTQALTQAQRHGPGRIEVQRPLAQLYLLTAGQLDARQDELLARATRYTLGWSRPAAQQLASLAEQTAQQRRLCTQLPDHISWGGQVCP